jgi:hypothetical protein
MVILQNPCRTDEAAPRKLWPGAAPRRVSARLVTPGHRAAAAAAEGPGTRSSLGRQQADRVSAPERPGRGPATPTHRRVLGHDVAGHATARLLLLRHTVDSPEPEPTEEHIAHVLVPLVVGMALVA